MSRPKTQESKRSKNSGTGDFEYGIRSIHTSNTNGVCSGCGGVAYVGSFDSAADLPAYNFNKGINGGGNTQSHEIGHTVSLSHDGLTTPRDNLLQRARHRRDGVGADHGLVLRNKDHDLFQR